MTRPSSRAPLLLVLVWVGGLVAATSVGLLAVRLVAAQVGDPAVAPLSAVAAASAAPAPSLLGRPAPTAPARPVGTPTGAAGSSQGPTTRTFSTAAGTVGVQCDGTALRLVYATPAQGWALDERSVAGAQAEVRFEGADTRLRVRLSCTTGVPQLVEQRTDQDGDDQDDRDDDEDSGGDGGGDDDLDRPDDG